MFSVVANEVKILVNQRLFLQLEIKDHHTNSMQRMEMLNDSKVSDLYTELESDLGTWVSEPGYMLIGWTCAEFDSPVDDVLSPFMQTCLGYE